MTTPIALASRPHVWRPGAGGRPPLLLLHGTGGDEQEIHWLGEAIDVDAPALSVRGSVVEGEWFRYFRRLEEGVLDEEDIRREAAELAEWLEAASLELGVEPGSWVAVGFSNGANMASSLLMLHPDSLAGAVVVAGMLPFAEGFAMDLAGKVVVCSNGANDPHVPQGHTEELVRRLRDAGAVVHERHHDGGHEVVRETLPEVAQLLAAR